MTPAADDRALAVLKSYTLSRAESSPNKKLGILYDVVADTRQYTGKWRGLYPDGRQRVPDRLMVKIEAWRSAYQLQECTYGFPCAGVNPAIRCRRSASVA